MDKAALFDLADAIIDTYDSIVTIKYFDHDWMNDRFRLILTLPSGQDEIVRDAADFRDRIEPGLAAWKEWLESRSAPTS